MSQEIATGSGRIPGASIDGSAGRTRALLAGGALTGPLFIVVSLVQAFTRPGFDLTRHPISMLSLGDLGWIQVANFLVTGLLALALAAGARRALHPGPAGTWGPLLIAAYGAGMLAAGVFRTDPALGFPPGAPAGMPAAASAHAALHNLAFFVAFTGLIAASVVLARRFAAARRRGWAIYSAATALAAPLLIAVAATGVAGVWRAARPAGHGDVGLALPGRPAAAGGAGWRGRCVRSVRSGGGCDAGSAGSRARIRGGLGGEGRRQGACLPDGRLRLQQPARP